MAICMLLPRTNYKQCGEPTRYTFALKLLLYRQIAECPPLTEPQYAEKLVALSDYDRWPSIG